MRALPKPMASYYINHAAELEKSKAAGATAKAKASANAAHHRDVSAEGRYAIGAAPGSDADAFTLHKMKAHA